MSVVMYRDGNLLRYKPRTTAEEEAITKALSYKKFVQIMENGKKEFYLEPIRCWEKVRDQLIFPFGFYEKIGRLLTTFGHKVMIADVRPRKNKQQVYTPDLAPLKKQDLRFKQDQVINMIINKHRGRVDCPPGYGKTHLIGLMALVFPKAKIDIVVPSIGLAMDFYRKISVNLPNIGICCSAKKRLGERITIYTIKSLHYAEGDADFVFADEIHEMGSADNISRFVRYKHSRIFGFSASHNKRMDKADFELEGIFGPIRVKVTPEEAREHEIQVPTTVIWHSVGGPREDYPTWYSDNRKDQAAYQCHNRRNLVIKQVADSISDDTQVLIVVSKLLHALRLKQLLPNFSLCYSPTNKNNKRVRKIYKFLGQNFVSLTNELAQELKENFANQTVKKVIATGVWNRGVDFRALVHLIRADGSVSPILADQIPGRAQRVCPEQNKTEAFIHDFEDEHSAWSENRAKTRRSNYKKNGLKQIQANVVSNPRRRAR